MADWETQAKQDAEYLIEMTNRAVRALNQISRDTRREARETTVATAMVMLATKEAGRG